jgi:Domain of unknown function (DUF5615)
MIQVLLDQGRAPRAAALLAERGMNAVHVSEIGLAEAQDAEILQAERDSGPFASRSIAIFTLILRSREKVARP